jgi:hypothetical protein
MSRLLKYLMVIVVLGTLGLTGYGYLVDMSPDLDERRVPVMLDGG